MIKEFLSCDWGTSALRIRLVRNYDLKILIENENDQGIAEIHKKWIEQEQDAQQRIPFYQSILKERIEELEYNYKYSLSGIPIIISGMASSSLGLVELPYSKVPLKIDDLNLGTELITASKKFNHDILLISGLQTKNDVMRGEETQLLGVLNKNITDMVCVFPGTHSKHIFIEKRTLTGFKTYMTGELFQLLSKQSSLSTAIEQSKSPMQSSHINYFKKGVQNGVKNNLLNASFSIRANHVLHVLDKTLNFYHLSGILIGSELKELMALNTPISIIGNSSINELYNLALTEIGISQKVKFNDITIATIKGQSLIASKVLN